jgi:hypothetical protein
MDDDERVGSHPGGLSVEQMKFHHLLDGGGPKTLRLLGSSVPVNSVATVMPPVVAIAASWHVPLVLQPLYESVHILDQMEP